MKPAAAIILVVGLSTAAQAVETGTLTLACKGTTVTGEGAPDPLSRRLTPRNQVVKQTYRQRKDHGRGPLARDVMQCGEIA